MKAVIFNPVERTFLAINSRFYSLKRKARRAPAPYLFKSKSAAKDVIRQNEFEDCVPVIPEAIKQTRPRAAVVRRSK